MQPLVMAHLGRLGNLALVPTAHPVILLVPAVSLENLVLAPAAHRASLLVPEVRPGSSARV